jgi:ornithine--oxo-acid transaminase
VWSRFAFASQCIEREERYNAQNYQPLPVVIESGLGVTVVDVDGKEYTDFLSAYSSVNQGHRHPRIINALKEQADKLTLISRAFYTDRLGVYAEFMTKQFGFDRILPMNTGVEAGETAIKMSRRWGYDVKGIAPNEAVVIVARNNFWGRTLAAVSSSSDPSCSTGFGPFLPGFEMVDYGDSEALEETIREIGSDRVCAFMVEPIQGEAGVVVPPEGYLGRVRDICTRHNVLLVADEVQTGLARTGRMMCCDWDGVKPDLLLLGKALSGGVLPVSAVLGSEEVVGSIKRGQHGSTFGGNPLACAVAQEAVQVIIDEELASKADKLGNVFRSQLQLVVDDDTSLVTAVRGRGLLNAVDVTPSTNSKTGAKLDAWEACLRLAERGILAKPTHGNIIRFAPPLVIEESHLIDCCGVIRDTLAEMADEAR